MIKKMGVILYLLMQFIYFNKVQANTVIDEKFIKDDICEVKAFDNNTADKKASLILQMTLKKHVSGVAYGVEFELFNNTNRNLAILTPLNIRDKFPLSIILNHNRQKISLEPRRYSMDGENGEAEEFTIQAGAKKKWLVNFKEILQTNDEVKKLLTSDNEGRLIMIFGFGYYLDGNGCDKHYRPGSMGKHMENVHFSLESYTLPN